MKGGQYGVGEGGQYGGGEGGQYGGEKKGKENRYKEGEIQEYFLTRLQDGSDIKQNALVLHAKKTKVVCYIIIFPYFGTGRGFLISAFVL